MDARNVMLTELEQNKIHSDNRILIVKPIEGKEVLSSTGLIDSRLFKGGNSIHAIRDPIDGLWFLRYKAPAVLPLQLKQKFTSFLSLKAFADGYFRKRGLQIVEVVDYYAED